MTRIKRDINQLVDDWVADGAPSIPDIEDLDWDGAVSDLVAGTLGGGRDDDQFESAMAELSRWYAGAYGVGEQTTGGRQ